MAFFFFFFFFQAEDGIRDTSVTGVQTCALPISGEEGSSECERVSAWCRDWLCLRASSASCAEDRLAIRRAGCPEAAERRRRLRDESRQVQQDPFREECAPAQFRLGRLPCELLQCVNRHPNRLANESSRSGLGVQRLRCWRAPSWPSSRRPQKRNEIPAHASRPAWRQ